MFINQENLNDLKFQEEFNLIEKEFKRTSEYFSILFSTNSMLELQMEILLDVNTLLR
jgi:hypothetical protein